MKKRMTRLMAMAMIIATTVTMGLSGCGKKDDGVKKDEKAVNDNNTNTEEDVLQGKASFRFITAMSDAERTEIIDSVVDQLKEKYPNVTFENESGSDYNNKAKLAFSSGSGYELVFTDDLGLTALREADYLLDLSEYIKEKGWGDKQLEGATDFYNQRTPDEQYTVGMNYAPVIVYYNKEIFEDLGVEIPKTLDEYENILKVATENGYIGSENCKDNINGWYVQSIVQNKAPFDDVLKWYYREESKDTMKTAFIEATEIVKKWSDAGYFRKDYEGIEYGDVPSLFGQGKAAMSLDGNWFLYDYESTGLDVGVFAFPGVTDASADNYIINPVDAAFAVGKHVDETQLAVAIDFIDLMLTPETAELWLDKGSIPSLNHNFDDSKASDLTKELLTVLSDTKSGFYLDNVKPGFFELFIKEMQLVISGDQSANDMWNRYDEFWNQD